jgi:DNA ligase (NAD+)
MSKVKTAISINKLIKELNNDPIQFVTDKDIKILEKVIEYSADKYYNDQPVISDEIYDFLIDILKDLEPENIILKKVGAKIIKTKDKDKVKLPHYMGSMDKIKPTDESHLEKWIKQYKKPYVYSDKLDGISALFVNKDNKLCLYTRGDGYEGLDISSYIEYIPTLKNVKIPNDYAVRGELIMSKKNFKKYEDKMANARNMVSGVILSKKIDSHIVSDIDFIAYELVEPWIISQSEQFKILKDLGFNTVFNESNIDIDFGNLSYILSNRKNMSDYEIDGIIVSSDILPSKRSSGSNPEYAFAFKDASLSYTANVEVLNVEWSVSKDNYIKPKLNIVPTKLSGVVISNVTAFNAKFVKDNILGPGAVIELIRSGDVIPHIQKVIKPSKTGKAQFPDMEYRWTDTGVDIIATSTNIEQQIRELTFFYKKLDIKNVDESTVKKMIENDINSIKKILEISKGDLSKLQGFGEKMIEKIYKNIRDRIDNLTMLDLMIASNIFGHGIGDKKLKKIIESYPDIIKLYSENDHDEIVNKIKQLSGFELKTAEAFTIGLDRFIDMFNTLQPDMKKQLRLSMIVEPKSEDESDNKTIFLGKTVVFSGFRNKEWEKLIEDNGGKINSSVSSKTSMLVTTKNDLEMRTNAKVIKALELKIPIMTIEDFKEFLENNN